IIENKRNPGNSILFDYNPSNKSLILAYKDQIKLELQNKNINIIEINLFKVIIDFLKKEGSLENLFKAEISVGSKHFIEFLRTKLNSNLLILEIINLFQKNKNSFSEHFILLDGLDSCHPLIDINTLVKSIETITQIECKILIFYPGKLYRQHLYIFQNNIENITLNKNGFYYPKYSLFD
ncbi:MAG: BREX protein BrxB domain-containing protein, partial [Psittacicella sp.]